ncbi:MAG: hypothetical protein IJ593_00290 [Lachnospiraceae bacterium]|nr:hypothetical protein [Lachnospiraceae bacterium]
MSVMKLNDEEFLFLSEMFISSDLAKSNRLGRSELYNIFRNLNVLGLCERYSDLFKETWQEDKRFDYIYQQYNTIGADIKSMSTSASIILNLVESDRVYNAYDEKTDEISAKNVFNSLHYNSMGFNKFLSAFYKDLYEKEYLNALQKPEGYRTQSQESIIRYYKYNILSEEQKLDINKSPNDFIKEQLYRSPTRIGDENAKIDKVTLIDRANYFAKQKALIDIANDDKLMKGFITVDIIESKIEEYKAIGKIAAIELYNEKFAKEERQEINNGNSDYKDEIDKVLSESYVRKDEYNDVRICKTPAIYGEIGLDTTKDMFMSREHIRYDNRIHGIEKEQFYNLPNLLKEPAIILKSQNREKAIIAIINDIDNNNMPIMASIYQDGNAKYNFEKIDSNFITSVYGRNNFKNFINTALNENRLLFTDQKVINELEKKAGIEIFKEKNVLTKNDVMQQ